MAIAYQGMMGGRGMYSMMGGAYWPVGIFLEILIIIIFLVVLYWLVRSRHQGETAESILKKRYARGEIDRKEYNKLLKDITEEPSENNKDK